MTTNNLENHSIASIKQWSGYIYNYDEISCTCQLILMNKNLFFHIAKDIRFDNFCQLVCNKIF